MKIDPDLNTEDLTKIQSPHQPCFITSSLSKLEQDKETILKRKARFKEVEHLASLGHWELDLVTNSLYWSDEIYRIFDLDPEGFEATYESFLEIVHPDDRKFVHKAFSESIKNRTDYDIVHRLLLKDGRIKYVHEKCQTIYDTDGSPSRSIGTVQDISRQKKEAHSFSGIIGRDANMLELFETIRQVADVDIPILIQGESGTGKELIARAIHNEGPRSDKPFVPVNCGALPEGLLESELFGHVKGAFTGAVRNRKGRFEMAQGGTLFLDEVADLSKMVQAKLLRVLQEGTFEQVGSEKTLLADVRIISAANRVLKSEMEKGRFRKLDPRRVKDALLRSGGNKAKASRLLGVGRATLYRFLAAFPDVSSNISESER